jgi:peptidoglycan/xylan/chitin deacetylase (PgdA/CDA1 family)
MNAAPPLKAVRHALAVLVGGSGLARALIRRRRLPRLIILVYHRVGGPPDELRPWVCARHFESHVRYLQRHFDVRTLGDVVATLKSGRPVPRLVVALTFDDGYRDLAVHAYPLLCRHGLPASAYVATDLVSTRALSWSDRLAHILLRARRRTLAGDLAAAPRPLDLRSPRGRSRAWLALTERLSRLPETDRPAALLRLAEAAGLAEADLGDGNLMLRWDDLRLMDPRLMEIGSHTRTHAILGTAEPARVQDEVEGSKRTLETMLGREAAGLTYPNGSSSSVAADAARRAGYRYACTVGGLDNPLPPPDVYSLRRIHVEDWPLARFVAEISPYGEIVRRGRASPRL